MGQGNRQPTTRIHNIISSADGAGMPGGGQTTQDDARMIVRPIVGIQQASAAEVIVSLSPGSPLFLEMGGADIEVYHGTTLLGWLGGSIGEVAARIAHGDSTPCVLHDVGGSIEEPTANAAIYL